jgi:ketosteroid isomerase-like protein
VSADGLAAVLDAFARRDLRAAAACFAADATYREVRREPIVGRAAIAARFAQFAAGAGGWRFDADDVIRCGDRACVVYRFATRGGDGEPWRERAGCAVVRWDERGDIAEWREYEA